MECALTWAFPAWKVPIRVLFLALSIGNLWRCNFFTCSSSTTGLDSILGRKLLDLNADFSRFILQLLQSCLPLESLCIAKGTHCWVLHVDVLVLGFGGNIFDVLNVAVLAALSSTKLPRVTISESLSSEFEQDAASVEVDSTSLTPLDVSKFPLTLTVCFPFDGAPEFYYDASVSEELASSTRIYITLLKSGKVCALRMGGGGTVEPLQLLQCIQQAKRQIPMLFSLVQSPSVPPNEPLF